MIIDQSPSLFSKVLCKILIIMNNWMKVKLFLKFRKNDEKNEQSLEKVILDMLTLKKAGGRR